jgi:dipeptidyl aminopeptidase/acylaminoacyl peptidase
VVIHGGPTYASFRTFNLDAQRFAANGWIVFEPNYRGSDNLGATFMGAIHNDAIAGPSRDIMAGLEQLRSRGLVRGGKVAVYGTSYGGTLSAALLGLYPSEWAAGVVGSAILDWTDEYYLSDSPWWAEFSFGFAPDTAEHRVTYTEQSPLAYAGRVTAPTLILSDLGDMRAPEVQSVRFWEQLKLRGTVTSLIVYEVAGHMPNDPRDIHDVQDRSILWLTPYLQ